MQIIILIFSFNEDNYDTNINVTAREMLWLRKLDDKSDKLSKTARALNVK